MVRDILPQHPDDAVLLGICRRDGVVEGREVLVAEVPCVHMVISCLFFFPSSLTKEEKRSRTAMALLAPVNALAAACAVVAEDDARAALRVKSDGAARRDVVVGGVERDRGRRGGREGADGQGQGREEGLDVDHFESCGVMLSMLSVVWALNGCVC